MKLIASSTDSFYLNPISPSSAKANVESGYLILNAFVTGAITWANKYILREEPCA